MAEPDGIIGVRRGHISSDRVDSVVAVVSLDIEVDPDHPTPLDGLIKIESRIISGECAIAAPDEPDWCTPASCKRRSRGDPTPERLGTLDVILKPLRDPRFVEERLVRFTVARTEVVIVVGARLTRGVRQSGEVLDSFDAIISEDCLVVPR
jgi:hypothetical protein